MEANRPGRRWSGRAIGFGVVLAVLAGWAGYAVATDRDPAEVVADFLTAVAERDVEGALALVSPSGYGVPFGDAAAFLDPEAIAEGWWVVSVREVGREYDDSARVEAVLAGPGGTADGEFEVTERDGEWLLTDPFARVRFPASPLGYVQVNDAVLDRPGGERPNEVYSLFPGVYRFYGARPGVVDTPGTPAVAAFPQLSGRDERLVVPAPLTAGEDVVRKAQREVESRTVECAGFATADPHEHCPFVTDGEIDTPDGRRLTELRGLKWTVKRQPRIALADERAEDLVPGFAVETVEPGAVTLSGTGTDTNDDTTPFTVTCEIDLTGHRVQVSPTGAVTLTVSPAARAATDRNTCRRNT